MRLRARKTKRYGQRVPISSAITLGTQLSSFKNLTRKGGKFDHRPGRAKVLLRHCLVITIKDAANNLTTSSSRKHATAEQHATFKLVIHYIAIDKH